MPPRNCPASKKLFCFSVHGVFATEPAVFVEFKLVRGASFILCGGIISPFAFSARKRNNNPHRQTPYL
jgi:hypothetical protein